MFKDWIGNQLKKHTQFEERFRLTFRKFGVILRNTGFFEANNKKDKFKLLGKNMTYYEWGKTSLTFGGREMCVRLTVSPPELRWWFPEKLKKSLLKLSFNQNRPGKNASRNNPFDLQAHYHPRMHAHRNICKHTLALPPQESMLGRNVWVFRAKKLQCQTF